jgi:protein-L-isoaspartate(D-aspartate) O-methyltransferase
MPDYAAARRMMVECQLRTFDITDKAVLAAMLAVPRERFVPPAQIDLAYLDAEVPVGKGRRLLKPMIFGRMLQAAAIDPGDRILDVGSATGYSAAVLSRIGAAVVALEQELELIRPARPLLPEVSDTHVSVVEGPLTDGWPAEGPYDVIIVEGQCDTVPDKLLGQLAADGRLVTIMGPGPAPKAMVFRNVDGRPSGRPVFDASGPVLPGFVRPPAFQF